MIDLLQKAVAKRARLLTPETNAVRLIDGGGDSLPGLILETYAGRWLVSTTGDRLAPQVREWLRDQGVSCYWKRLDPHQKESPMRLCGPEVSAPFLIREHGVCYEISFHAGYSQGIFLDQRDNRAEVRRLFEGFGKDGGYVLSASDHFFDVPPANLRVYAQAAHACAY